MSEEERKARSMMRMGDNGFMLCRQKYYVAIDRQDGVTTATVYEPEVEPKRKGPKDRKAIQYNDLMRVVEVFHFTGEMGSTSMLRKMLKRIMKEYDRTGEINL